jgi:hypothetical protein
MMFKVYVRLRESIYEGVAVADAWDDEETRALFATD